MHIAGNLFYMDYAQKQSQFEINDDYYGNYRQLNRIANRRLKAKTSNLLKTCSYRTLTITTFIVGTFIKLVCV